MMNTAYPHTITRLINHILLRPDAAEADSASLCMEVIH
jgi:hypothetical protein